VSLCGVMAKSWTLESTCVEHWSEYGIYPTLVPLVSWCLLVTSTLVPYLKSWSHPAGAPFHFYPLNSEQALVNGLLE
jgi:hypothetical protein